MECEYEHWRSKINKTVTLEERRLIIMILFQSQEVIPGTNASNEVLPATACTASSCTIYTGAGVCDVCTGQVSDGNRCGACVEGFVCGNSCTSACIDVCQSNCTNFCSKNIIF